MSTNFADLVAQERNKAIERVSEYVDDLDAVLPITEARCLQHFSKQLEELWNTEGEQVAVHMAAQEALRMIVERYVGVVLRHFGPLKGGTRDELLVPGKGVKVLAAEGILLALLFLSPDRSQTQDMVEEYFADADYAFKWMIEKGFARIRKLQTSLRVDTLDELGVFTRICDYRLLMLEAATDTYDEWVYDFVEVLVGQTDSHELLRKSRIGIRREDVEGVIHDCKSDDREGWDAARHPNAIRCRELSGSGNTSNSIKAPLAA